MSSAMDELFTLSLHGPPDGGRAYLVTASINVALLREGKSRNSEVVGVGELSHSLRASGAWSVVWCIAIQSMRSFTRWAVVAIQSCLHRHEAGGGSYAAGSLGCAVQLQSPEIINLRKLVQLHAKHHPFALDNRV